MKVFSTELCFHHNVCCSCARGSTKRQLLYEKAGHFQVIFFSMCALNEQSNQSSWGDRMTGFWFFQVPYLEDPNTGVQMFESAEIVEYLRATYVVWEAEKSSAAWGICFLCSCKVSQFDIILNYFSYDWYTWSHAVWEIQMLEQLENNRISNYLRALVPCGNTFQVILQRLLYVLVSIYLII